MTRYTKKDFGDIEKGILSYTSLSPFRKRAKKGTMCSVCKKYRYGYANEDMINLYGMCNLCLAKHRGRVKLKRVI